MKRIKNLFQNAFKTRRQNEETQSAPGEADFEAGMVLYQQALQESETKGSEEKALSLYHQALLHFRRAHEAGPDNYYTLCIWGDALKDAAYCTPNSAALVLWKEASDKYRQTIDLQPEDSDKYQIFANWGIALHKQAELSKINESGNLLRQAADKYELALQLKPKAPDILANYAAALSDLAAHKDISPDAARDLLIQASQLCELSFNQDPNSPATLSNWGSLISQQAIHADKDNACDLWKSAIDKFKQAIELDPNSALALNGWANALLSQATYEGNNAEALLVLSMEKTHQSLALAPNNEDALDNWGRALIAQANLQSTSTESAKQLYEQAIEKYQKILSQNANNENARLCVIATFSAWGHKLLTAALKKVKQKKHPEEAEATEQLLQGAMEKFHQVLALDADNLYALYHWGMTLHLQAQVAEGEKQKSLLSEAEQKYLQVDSLKTGHSAYGLASLAAARGEVDNARQWLDKGGQNKTLPLRHQIEDDWDFEGYYAYQWFKDILQQTPEE